MRRAPRRVLGTVAPSPRATAQGALWLACVLSVPVFVILTGVELIFWLVF